MRIWRALVYRLRRWWANPAPTPRAIRERRARRGERPVPIELAFFLHPDGRVYKRSRSGDGDIRIDNLYVKDLVFREYEQMVRIARKEQALAGLMLKALRRLRGRQQTDAA